MTGLRYGTRIGVAELDEREAERFVRRFEQHCGASLREDCPKLSTEVRGVKPFLIDATIFSHKADFRWQETQSLLNICGFHPSSRSSSSEPSSSSSSVTATASTKKVVE